jgi:hypothetical protein
MVATKDTILAIGQRTEHLVVSRTQSLRHVKHGGRVPHEDPTASPLMHSPELSEHQWALAPSGSDNSQVAISAIARLAC